MKTKIKHISGAIITIEHIFKFGKGELEVFESMAPSKILKYAASRDEGIKKAIALRSEYNCRHVYQQNSTIPACRLCGKIKPD